MFQYFTTFLIMIRDFLSFSVIFRHFPLFCPSFPVILSVISRYSVRHFPLFCPSFPVIQSSFPVILSVISRYSVRHFPLFWPSFPVILSVISRYSVGHFPLFRRGTTKTDAFASGGTYFFATRPVIKCEIVHHLFLRIWAIFAKNKSLNSIYLTNPLGSSILVRTHQRVEGSSQCVRSILKVSLSYTNCVQGGGTLNG